MGGNPISAGELRRIARLAGLDVESCDLERLRGEVSRVLALAGTLVGGDLPGGRLRPGADEGTGAPAQAPQQAVLSGAGGLALREDECREPESADRLLDAAPLVRERHVIVPRIIG